MTRNLSDASTGSDATDKTDEARGISPAQSQHEENPGQPDMIERAVDALRRGEMVVFPTDTVFGCGVSVNHPASIERIYEAKKRDHAKPIAWLVSSATEALKYMQNPTPEIHALMEAFWPGALTIIVKAHPDVPAACKSSASTIGLRMPDHEVALKLIKACGSPIATSSANISGEASVARADKLDARLVSSAAVVLPDDYPASGISSTVIDVSQGDLNIVREGEITRAQIEQVMSSAAPKAHRTEVSADEDSTDDTSALDATPAPNTAHPQNALCAFDTTIASSITDICPDEKPAHIMVRLRWSAYATKRTPTTMVQIIHGMSEHSERYEAFVRKLVDAGYIVCMHDHIGHGYSVESLDELGDMPLRGNEIMLKDIERVRSFADAFFAERQIACDQHILMGHSMGSFLARVFIETHTDTYAGIILSGTGDPSFVLSRIGYTLCRVMAGIFGHAHRSKLIHALGAGSFSRSIKGAHTPLDWLCSDPRVVMRYACDERCGQMFSVGAYGSLSALTYDAHAALNSSQMNLGGFAMLLISGKDDVVGDFGKSATRVAREYRARGVDLMCILYEGMRHEILNEHDKDQVIRDIITWLDGVSARDASI